MGLRWIGFTEMPVRRVLAPLKCLNGATLEGCIDTLKQLEQLKSAGSCLNHETGSEIPHDLFI